MPIKLPKLPKLPSLFARKLYKTGQTRGADDDEIYQNRVSRNSTILIPYSQFNKVKKSQPKLDFDNGYIVLVDPETYYRRKSSIASDLKLGSNLLLFYETRDQWNEFSPKKRGLKPATNRTTPLGGEYVARIPATTAARNGKKVNEGFTKTAKKGAGIRAYEYAPMSTLVNTRIQLEAVFWTCEDSLKTVQDFGLNIHDAKTRRETITKIAVAEKLFDVERLQKARILNKELRAICPLCLEELSSIGFFSKMEQAEGREVIDLTITQLNLFHIEELRYGLWNHREYNLGWGHHHCNVVAKDAGISETLAWMKQVIKRNEEA